MKAFEEPKDTSKMKKLTLTRTSGRDVRFTGEEVADAGGKWREGVEQNRWTELTLYRTKGGKYVLSRYYYTQWQGESNNFEVTVCADAQAVMRALCSKGDADYPEPDRPEDELGELEAKLLREAAKNDPEHFGKTAVEEVE